MERISEKKLPPIFKMSVLYNILPYYGYIHRWRRLLEKINTETKEIWDQNREQLMYIGRDFKRDIELDSFKIYRSKLRPNRSWIDLFSLSLSYDFCKKKFDLTNLIDNLTGDEVIIIDSHDDIFKGYQIHYWSKDCISDILPAIKCPSFKSETKNYKTSMIEEMKQFIFDQSHTKSIIIENAGDKLSISLVYGNIIKITHMTFSSFHIIKFFDKLQERYKLWEIDDCACKPKKIRVRAESIENVKITIDKLKWISNIIDVKLGMHINCVQFTKVFFNYNSMFFNHSARRMSHSDTNFIFTGDTLAVVDKGNYYDFRLDQRTKESENSYIMWRNIIENESKSCFALDVNEIYNFRFILTDKEDKYSEDKGFIEDLKKCSTHEERCFIVFDKKDITLKIDIDRVKMKMPEQEFYSKVDVRINDKIGSEDIIKLLKHIPNHLSIRLEADYFDDIVELMNCDILIEKLREQGIKFWHNGIEIEPRIIKSKMDEHAFKNEVKKTEAKRDRLSMDCDK